ncbi:MAG: DNA-binding transcriptional regulator, IscR family [Chloroflexi bacterium]|nr:MAG: DNA-binding transcriptional regulator, IscR family [Chloroflexota bacterium]
MTEEDDVRVPMKVDYGVRALVDLAERLGEGPVQASEVAARQNVPEPYLDQLLTTLQKFGFVRSRRGPQGGHTLARAPEEVTLGMVFASLEGTAAPLECIDEPGECSLSDTCAQRDVWRTVDEAVQSLLSATSIADLMTRQRQRVSGGVYQI